MEEWSSIYLFQRTREEMIHLTSHNREKEQRESVLCQRSYQTRMCQDKEDLGGGAEEVSHVGRRQGD